jgi:hypothetical protein
MQREVGIIMIQIGEIYCRNLIISNIALGVVIPSSQLNTALFFNIERKKAYVFSFEVTAFTEVEKFMIYIYNSNIDVYINTFMYSAGTYLMYGNVKMTASSQAFQIEAAKGLYYMCVYNNSSIVGNFTSGDISRTVTFFPSIAKLYPVGHHGITAHASLQTSIIITDLNIYNGNKLFVGEMGNQTELSFVITVGETMRFRIPEPVASCDLPLVYELVDGTLPDGIVIDEDGLIHGCVKCLDSMESNIGLPASSTWMGYNSGEWRAWGRVWNFKIKVSLLSRPAFHTIANFCIRVYNNWSIERQEIEDADFDPSVVVIDIPENTYMEEYCVPCENQKENITKTTYMEEYCVPCENQKENITKTTYCNTCNSNTQVINNSITIPTSLSSFSEIELIDWFENGVANSDLEIIFRNDLSNSYIFKYLLTKQVTDKNNSVFLSKISQVLDLRMEIIHTENDIVYKVNNIIEDSNKQLDLVLTAFIGDSCNV